MPYSTPSRRVASTPARSEAPPRAPHARSERSAPRRRRTSLIALAVLSGTGLALTGCSDTPTPPAATPPATASASAPTPAATPSSPVQTPGGPVSLPTPAPTPTIGPLSQPFGPACSRLPDTGAGSRTALARQRVAAALADVPALSRAAAAVKTAGLSDTLNNQTDVTVFAPDDTAFTDSSTAIKRSLADPRRARDVLRYHVVPGRLAPDQLTGTHQTLSGSTLTVTGSGQDFTVDDRAHVVCGNLQTANATIYVIDGVLQPS